MKGYKYKLLKTRAVHKYENLNDILNIVNKLQDEIVSISYIEKENLFAVVIKTGIDKWHPEYYGYEVDRSME